MLAGPRAFHVLEALSRLMVHHGPGPLHHAAFPLSDACFWLVFNKQLWENKPQLQCVIISVLQIFQPWPISSYLCEVGGLAKNRKTTIRRARKS